MKYENSRCAAAPYVITSALPRSGNRAARRESYYMHNGKQVRDKPSSRQVRFRDHRRHNTALLALKWRDIDEMELSAGAMDNQTSDEDFYEHNTKARGVNGSTSTSAGTTIP